MLFELTKNDSMALVVNGQRNTLTAKVFVLDGMQRSISDGQQKLLRIFNFMHIQEDGIDCMSINWFMLAFLGLNLFNFWEGFLLRFPSHNRLFPTQLFLTVPYFPGAAL